MKSFRNINQTRSNKPLTKGQIKQLIQEERKELDREMQIVSSKRQSSNGSSKRRKKKSKVSKYAGALSEIGATVGGIFGLPGVGKMLGEKVASIFGSGDYVMSTVGVKNNSIMDAGNTPPQFGGSPGSTVIRHREFICDVRTGPNTSGGLTTFNYQEFSLNPGMVGTFPWLAAIANQYEEYSIRGMIFEFKSTSTDYAANTALGTVIMSTQYNVLNPAFINKQQQENYEFAQSVKPSQSAIHGVECKPNATPMERLYIRDGPAPANSDLRVYDMGKFQISTVGNQQANAYIGELWVSYDIELLKPRMPVGGVTGDELSAHVEFTGTVNSANFFGTGYVVHQGSSLAMTVDVANKVISFPPLLQDGKFLITFYTTQVSAAAITSWGGLTFVNCRYAVSPPDFTNGGASIWAPDNGVVSVNGIKSILVEVTGQNASFAIGIAPVYGGTVLTSDFYVTAINPEQA